MKKVEKSLAGGIWLCVVGGLGLLGVLMVLAGEIEAAALVVYILMALALPIGIWLIVRNSKFNKEHSHEIAIEREHKQEMLDTEFETTCMKCSNKFTYTLRGVRRHKRWPNGYVDCPYCRAHNAHNGNNKI